MGSHALLLPDDEAARPSGSLSGPLKDVFARIGEDDKIESLCATVAQMPSWHVIMHQSFHNATIIQLKRVLRIFEETQVRMEDAKTHKIISLLGDLRQKMSVRKDGVAIKVMSLFANDVDGKDRIFAQDMARLGEELYKLAKRYPKEDVKELEYEGYKKSVSEVLERERKTFEEMSKDETADDDSSIGHEVVRRFVAILSDAAEAGDMQWLGRSSPMKFLKETHKDLLPWTSVGFVLELLLDSGVLKSETIWFHANTIYRVRKIATKRIPKFTEKLSELIAMLENQSQGIDHLRNKSLACFAGIVAAAGPFIARLAFSYLVGSNMKIGRY